ncbi:hypothetical protein OG225_27485 [Nocardia sp. NBC_01377]|uniref:hypothetical protein n=1 Tax=Nocardia sp. NBC_01377 TaxID=2903595 RepID=UPI00325695DD
MPRPRAINTSVKKIAVSLAFGVAGLVTSIVGDAKTAETVTTVVVFGGLSFAAAEIIGFKNEQAQFRHEVLESIARLNSIVQQENSANRVATAEVTESLARATRLVSGRQTLSALDELVVGLAESVAKIDDSAPLLAHALVIEYVNRAIQCSAGPMTGEIVYPGEDRHMLLALAAAAQDRIDAVSPVILDGSDFWMSEFGIRYLEIQRQIIAERNVQVRRLFVVDDRDQISDRAVIQQIADHNSMGIDARVLIPEDAPPTLRRRLASIVLFDGCLSYEMTSSTRFSGSMAPLLTQTTVVFALDSVATRQMEFQRLWEVAVQAV